MFRPNRRAALLTLPLALLSLPALAQTSSPTDDPVARIKDEGLNRSQVMQTLSYLTDVIGPRLTASPSMKRANEWTRDKMTSWGLQNAHLEAWGPFGRGWSLEKFSAQIVAPHAIPLIAYPKAWSPGVRGTQTAEVIFVDARDDAGLEKYRGKLKGAIVLNGPVREVKAWFQPMGTRWTDEQLKRMEEGGPRRRPGGATGMVAEEELAHGEGQPGGFGSFASKKLKFYLEEGVALMVDPSFRGDGGTLFVQSATVPPPAKPEPGRRVGPWSKEAPRTVPQMVLSIEHYNRLVRMVQQGETLKMAVQMQVKFHDRDLMGYNTIAEIPGSSLKDEVVMMGAHMDSWHGGTGATDNAAGCAVVMEAVRILKTLNLPLRRTVRVGLWSGEEEGLFGSRAYVTEHFGTRPGSASGAASGTGGGIGTGTSGSGASAASAGGFKPEHEKFSVYFNLDNGTGKIRGVYLQGNEGVRPIFTEWLAPFKEMGATTITINNTGGTDHQSFDAVGLPGFQFIQDEIEYDTRTHHSNQDVYDRIQADDMKQAAVIMATFAYNAANRDEKLPRKPPPAPRTP